jgi:7-cyano-7-deazaguanine synthase
LPCPLYNAGVAKSIVLHSGGLDSSVTLLLAQQSADEVVSLGFDYGQAHAVELLYAAALCERLDVTRRLIKLEWDKPALGVPRNRTLEDMRSAPSAAFLPARNAVFLILAAAEAAGIGASELWLGVNALDYSGYPDCRPEFLAAFEAMLAQAMPDPPQLVAPLVEKTKPQIAVLARELGLSREETWSCYDPQLREGGVLPCGICDACQLNHFAWEGVEPTSSGRS